MTKAWIQDLWVKDHIIRDDDGKILQRLKPTSRELQAIKRLPEQYRSSFYGRGSRWRVNWFEHDGDGKRLRKTEDHPTKVQAEQRVLELTSALQAGTHVTRELRKQTFEDVSKMWIRSKQRIRPSTLKRYEDELRRYVRPKWGHREIDTIRQEEVEQWVAQLREGTAPHVFESEKRKQRPLEASAIKHIVRIVFGAVMRYCVSKGWISRSPVTGVELPEPSVRDIDAQILEGVELKALIDAAKLISEQDERLFTVLGFTGIRIGEAFALKVRDWNGKALTVRATLSETKDGVKLELPKSGSTRVIPVAPMVQLALDEQVKGKQAEDFIFANTRGGHLNVHNWRNRVFNVAVAGAGLDVEGFTPHSLRHTAASMAIAAGANILIVQRMLGHKNAQITLNVYGHLYPSDLDTIGQLIEARYVASLEATDS